MAEGRKQTEMKVTAQSASSSEEPTIGESVATVPTQDSFAGLVVKGKLGSGTSATVLDATRYGESVALKRGASQQVSTEAHILANMANPVAHPAVV